MFNGTAKVFRIRQAVSDLRSLIAAASDASLTRVMRDAGLPGQGGPQALQSIIEGTGARFASPRDDNAYAAVLHAATQPYTDFPVFVLSTALLLTDRLLDGRRGDDLCWNWEAFQDHYALADPPARAALMNGFRIGSETGRVLIDAPPHPSLCATRSLCEVAGSGQSGELVEVVRAGASARKAGRIWSRLDTGSLKQIDLRAARFLYERGASMAPPRAERVPLIPWSAE